MLTLYLYIYIYGAIVAPHFSGTGAVVPDVDISPDIIAIFALSIKVTCQHATYGRKNSSNRYSVNISLSQNYLHVSNKTLLVERKYKIANSLSSISPCLSDHRSALF